jgi:hypothetical protein
MPLNNDDIDNIILQKTGKKFEELIKKEVLAKTNEIDLEESYNNLDNNSKKIIQKHFNLYKSYICSECHKPVYNFGYCLNHYLIFMPNIKEEIDYFKQDLDRFKNYCSFLHAYKKQINLKIKNTRYYTNSGYDRKLNKLLILLIENIKNENFKINIFNEYDVEEISGKYLLENKNNSEQTTILHVQEKIKMYKKHINIINKIEDIEEIEQLLDHYKIESYSNYYNNYSIFEYIFSHLNKYKVIELCHNLEIIDELYNYDFVLELDCFGFIYNNTINSYIPFCIILDDEMCDKRLYCLLRSINFIYFTDTTRMKSNINKFLEQLQETNIILSINIS